MNLTAATPTPSNRSSSARAPRYSRGPSNGTRTTVTVNTSPSPPVSNTNP